MKKDLRILVLEDVAADVVLLDRELQSGGFSFATKRVETRDEFLRELEQSPPDLILSDHGLPEFDGFSALALARERCPDTPFIFVTGSMGEELAIDSLRSGAADYVLKTRISNLVPAVERAMRLAEERLKRKRAEQDLRASEERHRRIAAAIETALDAIVSLDREGRIVEWNPAAERIFGYSRELAVGRSLADVIVPASNQELRRKGFARSFSFGRGRGAAQRVELVASRANGAEFPVELTLAKIAREGSPGLTVFARDLTERRRSEDALRRSEQHYRQMIEGAQDYAIYLLDPHGRITTWNAGAERLMGYRASEIVGRRFHRFYSPPDANRKKPDVALTVATAEGRYQDECWQIRKDGQACWATLVLTALREADGKLTGFSVIARDTTARKQAEDDLRRLVTELEQRVQTCTADLQSAHQEMEAFSYSISHDLRAPLIHITGFAEMLKGDLGPALDAKSRRHLQTICDSAERMGGMIADLLAFSRIGRAELHLVRFNLGALVKELQRDLQVQTRTRRVTWGASDLPEVFGDPFLLRQAILHLLSNAIKFTRVREDAHIEITATTSDREQVFAVRDNGVGFDMKYAAKLFGVFQRLHSAEEFEGTGIGLALVRRIIGRHGGRTWAEGTIDGGATFYFSLPIVAEKT